MKSPDSRETMLQALERLNACIASEQADPPPLRTKRDIPATFGQITADWLTMALCSGHAGAQVLKHEIFGGSEGTTSRREIQISYNDAGNKAGLPTRLFAKATPDLSSRMACGPAGGLANETGFYNLIRNELKFEAPIAYYADYDPASYRSLVILSNISEEGATFLSPLHYINKTDAEGMLTVMAQYHGRYFGDPRLDGDYIWLHTSIEYQKIFNRFIDFETKSQIGIDRSESVIPQSVLSVRSKLWSAFMRSLELASRKPYTYLHNDVHAGNWYRTATGKMGLCDWQATVKGHWSLDVAYALTSALTIEDRRSWERDLLQFYIDRLTEAGGPHVKFETAWLEYRQQILRAFFFWVFTMGAGVHPDMQPNAISLLNIERMASALDDLDTLTSM